jgi:hypothetical protein
MPSAISCDSIYEADPVNELLELVVLNDAIALCSDRGMFFNFSVICAELSFAIRVPMFVMCLPTCV